MLNLIKNLLRKPKRPDLEKELLEKIYMQDLAWEPNGFGEYVATITNQDGKEHQITVCPVLEKARVKIDDIWFSYDKNIWLQYQILERAWAHINKKETEQRKKKLKDAEQKLKRINDKL